MTAVAAGPEKRPTSSAMAREVARMMMLERAATLVGGHDKLAEAMGIQGRSLRKKFSADRGVSDHDLEMAALAMEARVNEIIWAIEKCRNLIGPGEAQHGS